ncbi:hypothetical protein NQZ68_027004 [Dissostichus eleginoides]|nr:hypothetical protein NQZ68_027004 [Dissostichus eleginoides]
MGSQLKQSSDSDFPPPRQEPRGDDSTDGLIEIIAAGRSVGAEIHTGRESTPPSSRKLYESSGSGRGGEPHAGAGTAGGDL